MLKSTITEIQNSVEGFKYRFEQAQESANLKIRQWTLSSQKNRNKKD